MNCDGGQGSVRGGFLEAKAFEVSLIRQMEKREQKEQRRRGGVAGVCWERPAERMVTGPQPLKGWNFEDQVRIRLPLASSLSKR